jgi:pimeloyl-ACP methyl ester carboxylesterase
MQPFKLATPELVLKDLHRRLANTRWIDEVEDAGWYYGIPLGYMQEIVAYWQQGFDWRKQERYINSFPNYQIEIDGVNIHFVYVKGHGQKTLPLLLTHGWPSTFYEMLQLATLLADPEKHGGQPDEAFDVVIPSVPGHGFSDMARRRGFADREVAALWVKLMAALGYNRFAAHGYDLGASITGLLCLDYPERVIGYHTTSPGNPSPHIPADTSYWTDDEKAFLNVLEDWRRQEGGYAHLLGTRPQTVSYALNDSPVGLAAWILEKWYMWTLPSSGSLDAHFSKDDLLTTVMLYWLTQTINSANRYYREDVRWPGPDDRIRIPVGVALTATQAYERPPRSYVERICSDIRYWVDLQCGGHFVALEESARIAQSIRAFFTLLR